MKLISTECALCNSKNNFNVLYKRNFKKSDFNVKIFSARRLPDKIHYQMVKCNKDNLIRSNPILDNNTLLNLYKISEFTYEDEVENLKKSYIKAILPVLKELNHKSSLLEIGCGNGFILEELYNMGYKKTYGIEPSIEAVDKASRVIKKNIKTNILKRGLFKNNSFDFIFIFQTLDHIPNPNQFLKICYELLKPGGFILAFNHNVNSLSSKLLKEKSPIIDIEHTYLYDPKTMTELFVKNKFTVKNVYSPMNIISLKHLVWLLPIPKSIKKIILKSKIPILKFKLPLKLGNICLIAQK